LEISWTYYGLMISIYSATTHMFTFSIFHSFREIQRRLWPGIGLFCVSLELLALNVHLISFWLSTSFTLNPDVFKYSLILPHANCYEMKLQRHRRAPMGLHRIEFRCQILFAFRSFRSALARTWALFRFINLYNRPGNSWVFEVIRDLERPKKPQRCKDILRKKLKRQS